MDLKEHGLAYFCKTYQVDPVGDYSIERVPARELLSPERIDVMAKLKYVESRESGLNVEYAVGLYRRNIEACTLGMFAELGNEEKETFEDFLKVFDELIDSIKDSGVDENISVLPVGNRGFIMDGAHRLSIAAYFNQEVPIIRFDLDETSMDADFFRQRMTSEEDLDYLAAELCKWREDLYLCCLWPSASPTEKREAAIGFLRDYGTVVHRKTIHITYNGLHNLIPQIYSRMDWVGSINDQFLSATPKVNACDGESALDVILFQGASLASVKDLKERMRAVFNIQEHSLHISDYPDETLALARMLFHKNTIDFLNNGQPFQYVQMNRLIYAFSAKIQDAKASPEDYIIDSGTVMGLFGFRKPDDLDYLTVDTNRLFEGESNINDHSEELEYYKADLDALLFDPANYFYYMGLKFITLRVLLDFKKRRDSLKDKEDVKIIEANLSNERRLRALLLKACQYCRRKGRNLAFQFLHRVPFNGYDRARDLYHFIRDLKGRDG